MISIEIENRSHELQFKKKIKNDFIKKFKSE